MDQHRNVNHQRPESKHDSGHRSRAGTRQPRILAISSGKGGVGKTSISLNLALTLARDGYRVLLLDGDTDLANVSIMLGQYPERNLAQVVAGECELADVIMSAPHGLDIVPGASGVQGCMDLGNADSMVLLKSLAQLERQYDYVLIDTAAGLQPVGLHMIAAAAMACIVVTPDPTSLTDAFSLIKVLQRRGYRRTPSVVVNMARGASQAQSVFQRLDSAAQRHLGTRLHYLGAVWRDETIQQSILAQRPVALMPESDPSCRQFHTLADMLGVRFGQLPPRKAGIAAYWHRVSMRARAQVPDPSPESASTGEDVGATCQGLVQQLGKLLAANPEATMLRYEAFNAIFALLGRTLDNDTIEIVQTGLASLGWESLSLPQREHFARHLRQLADQVAAEPHSAAVDRAPLASDPEPRYDRVSFGEQSSLIKALRDQPDDIPLDEFLRRLASDRSPR
ncbi:MinD-like ATPase involved in chromosome partitioning or flagellar assembly [Marinobacter mobilis]|uniref:MinD-like ATPase involved in chromosome partitioning or flagellar assembly n=2 Tax=Marinobacter mobilis TaxID=488533 RepID=A0A1H2ZZI1_9GAMM|nr:MinD-like ATPase involved in chromosome partitioning or flagellar assembly [Marinobacter mobilis]